MRLNSDLQFYRDRYGNKAASLKVMQLIPEISVPNFFLFDSLDSWYLPPTLENFCVSVRSSGLVSMPGMMDTILNVGMSDEKVTQLSDEFSAQFAYDCYSRFLESFGSIVLGIPKHEFRTKRDALNSFYQGLPWTEQDHRLLMSAFIDIWTDHKKQDVLYETPDEHTKQAIQAVFKSWYNDRAASYRETEGISHEVKMGVIVQQMVYGNLNDRSCTGVMFSRNPNTGEDCIYGDFLVGAQGEDVVGGSHKTLDISKFETRFPRLLDELLSVSDKLEELYKAPVDIEFTVENDKLYILQCREAKISPQALLRSTLELRVNGIITTDEGIEKLTSMGLLPETEAGEIDGKLIGSGVGAVPGVVHGEVFTGDADDIPTVPFILVRQQTDPDDVILFGKAAGILTLEGGLVSHAAVVARAWNVPCVVGFNDSGRFHDLMLGNQIQITIDGETGRVYERD